MLCCVFAVHTKQQGSIFKCLHFWQHFQMHACSMKTIHIFEHISVDNRWKCLNFKKHQFEYDIKNKITIKKCKKSISADDKLKMHWQKCVNKNELLRQGPKAKDSTVCFTYSINTHLLWLVLGKHFIPCTNERLLLENHNNKYTINKSWIQLCLAFSHIETNNSIEFCCISDNFRS